MNANVVVIISLNSVHGRWRFPCSLRSKNNNQGFGTLPATGYVDVWVTKPWYRLRSFCRKCSTKWLQIFNDCQFQVEQRDAPGSTTYKITVRGCLCRRSYSASVGKQTSSRFEETAGLSASYFFPMHIFKGSYRNDQTSSIFINRTALAQDGVQIRSLKFLIIREPDNFLSDLLMKSSFGYILT